MVDKTFAEEVKRAIEERTEGVVEIRTIKKNNGVELTGLTIQKEGALMSPTLYLEEMDYLQPRDAAEKLLEIFQNANMPEVDVSWLTDWDKAKRRIIYALVNQKANEEMLKELPHKEFLDLAIIFKVMLSVKGSHATVQVTNNHLDILGITVDDLMETAVKNTKELLPARVKGLNQTVSEMGGLMQPKEEDEQVFILTNNQNYFGAAAILYDGQIKNAAEKMGSDLFLIPSSVHEWLMIRADESVTGDELKSMICEVNSNAVSPHEVLGDHAYFYSREKAEIAAA